MTAIPISRRESSSKCFHVGEKRGFELLAAASSLASSSHPMLLPPLLSNRSDLKPGTKSTATMASPMISDEAWNERTNFIVTFSNLFHAHQVLEIEFRSHLNLL